MASNSSSCDQRDGYVGRWLTEGERGAFEDHLLQCPDCRQVVQEQQRLDRLLTRAHAVLRPVPAGLLGLIDHRLGHARRRRRAAWALGLAAAMVLIGSLTVWFLRQRVPDEGPQHPVMAESPPPPPAPTPDPRALVQVKFPPTAEVIAVPRK